MEGFYGQKPGGIGKLLPKEKKALFQPLVCQWSEFMFPKGGAANSWQDQRQHLGPGSPVVSASLEILIKIEDHIPSVDLA